MNTFKRKSLYAALAGVSALGVTGAAQAVNLNPDGLGQVLIYPYYTTRADLAETRTRRCCRSSIRPARRRRSRFASWKARTAEKCLTSTCSCRSTTSGPLRFLPHRGPARGRHARQVVHAASDSPCRPGVRELCVHRREQRQGRHQSRPHEGRLRRNHRDGDVHHRLDDVADRHARRWRSRAKRLHLRRPDRLRRRFATPTASRAASSAA